MSINISAKILFVDDDPNILSAYRRSLQKHFNLDCASNGDEALQFLNEKGPYAVIISDKRRPVMDGI